MFRIERRRTIGGETTCEVAYGITSLTPQQATADQLLDFARAHWGIENSLHHIRDVTLGEDACRVRTGAAPQVLAAMRNLVLSMIAPLSPKSIPTALRRFAAKPHEALRLIAKPPEN